jgi:hypothetical protein
MLVTKIIRKNFVVILPRLMFEYYWVTSSSYLKESYMVGTRGICC